MDSYIEALKRVPECRLEIFALVRELTNERGEVDEEKAVERYVEVTRASNAAKAYCADTGKAVRQLCALVR